MLQDMYLYRDHICTFILLYLYADHDDEHEPNLRVSVLEVVLPRDLEFDSQSKAIQDHACGSQLHSSVPIEPEGYHAGESC